MTSAPGSTLSCSSIQRRNNNKSNKYNSVRTDKAMVQQVLLLPLLLFVRGPTFSTTKTLWSVDAASDDPNEVNSIALCDFTKSCVHDEDCIGESQCALNHEKDEVRRSGPGYKKSTKTDKGICFDEKALVGIELITDGKKVSGGGGGDPHFRMYDGTTTATVISFWRRRRTTVVLLLVVVLRHHPPPPPP
jgi:hypothetical protein